MSGGCHEWNTRKMACWKKSVVGNQIRYSTFHNHGLTSKILVIDNTVGSDGIAVVPERISQIFIASVPHVPIVRMIIH